MLNISRFTNYQGSLSNNFQQLINYKNDEINEKIEKSRKKKQLIQKLQKQIQEKAKVKNVELLKKVNKSIELKNMNLQKIKKKCKLRTEYQSQKTKQYYKQSKAEMLVSWRKSQKLSMQTPKKAELKKERQSHRLMSFQNQENPQPMQLRRSDTKPQSIKLPELKKKIFNNSKLDSQGQKEEEQIMKARSQKNIETKFKKSFTNIDEEIRKANEKKKKIESSDKSLKQMAIKLQKIDKIRMKKSQMQKQKQKKIHDVLEYKAMEFQERQKLRKSQRKGSKKRKHERSTTLPYQSSISPKNQQFKKWEQSSKERQQQFLQNRLKKGSIYLEMMKRKSSHHKLQKQIENISIEQKLFLERKKLGNLLTRSGMKM